MFKKKKIGLALSGGGAKGFAHIGVLKILEKYKIPIDFVSGTSMGAVIGAIYASDPNAKKMEKEILGENLKKLLDYSLLPERGLIKGKKIEALLEKYLGKLDFKDLKIPLFVTSYDLGSRREIIFHKGNVAKAVRASISIPGVFIPIENKNRILVDGAIIDPIPTEILKKSGADIIIAVNVDYVKFKTPITNEKATTKYHYKEIPKITTSAYKALQIMNSEMAESDLCRNQADFVININLNNLGILEFGKVKKTIKTGEKAAKKSLEDLRQVIKPHPLKSFLEELDKNIKEIKIPPIVPELGKKPKIFEKK